jgi:small ligand-binding sensory domain FIST
VTGVVSGSAFSEHPVPAQATGEVIGEVLDRVGPGPDLAVLFVTAHHAGALEDIVPAVHATLGPRHLVATTAVSVLSGAREIEEQPAVCLWAANLPYSMRTVRLEAELSPTGQPRVDIAPLTEVAQLGSEAHTLLLLADPYSFPVDALIEEAAQAMPDLVIAGGLASAAGQPGGNVMVADTTLSSSGAVGVLLSGATPPRTLVSQGCRPIGTPLTVTACENNLLLELAGQPALERLEELINSLTTEERNLASRGLHLGWVVNEQKLDFEPGDFLIRGVMGADRARKAVAVGDRIPLGATVQFQVRDANSADSELRSMLTAETPSQAALLFTCNGRGRRLFGQPDHDAELVHEHTDGALAGMFCAGEIGPVAGRNHMHGFTASALLFGESTTLL